VRKGDTDGGSDFAIIAYILTKTEESECVHVPKIRHVAEVYGHPLATISQSQILNRRILALLKQRQFLPITVIPEIDQVDGLEIWADRKLALVGINWYVKIEQTKGESLEGHEFLWETLEKILSVEDFRVVFPHEFCPAWSMFSTPSHEHSQQLTQPSC